MRISELAERVGVATSTVRYYERIGLLADPARASSGYRDYDDEAATRLLFVARARRMGLSCEQIGTLLGVWGGTDCEAAARRVGTLIEEKRDEIALRITELHGFAAQLETMRDELERQPRQSACCSDLSCCVPEAAEPIAIDLIPRPTGHAHYSFTRD